MVQSKVIVTLFCILSTCFGQKNTQTIQSRLPLDLHAGLTTKIGNFSLEILYHTTKATPPDQNLIISPFTMWTVLAVVHEGANEMTAIQIRNATRIDIKHGKSQVRLDYVKLSRWLQVMTDTVTLERVNTIFSDEENQLEKDFQDVARDYYQTTVAPLNLTDIVKTADQVNQHISRITHGRIPKLVEAGDFEQTKLLLISALYFKGQWSVPFNATQTEQKPFHDSNGKVIGNVKMMYNRHSYPFANIKELEARVIELPYGKENRLSMLIMLPNPNVTLEDMFLKFAKVPLDKVFSELKISQMEFGEDEVDCFIPRFKIESNLVLNKVLNDMGIHDLFDPVRARLTRLARRPLYVTKVVHKAEIEVTEEGTTASAVTATEFANRIGVVRFEANRPFSYMIIEKKTNTIAFGGVYRQPSLY